VAIYPAYLTTVDFVDGEQSLADSIARGGGRGGEDARHARSFALRLTNDGVVTSDAGCGRLERARREKARALRFRAAVFVNGSKVIDRWIQTPLSPLFTVASRLSRLPNGGFDRKRRGAPRDAKAQAFDPPVRLLLLELCFLWLRHGQHGSEHETC